MLSFFWGTAPLSWSYFIEENYSLRYSLELSLIIAPDYFFFIYWKAADADKVCFTTTEVSIQTEPEEQTNNPVSSKQPTTEVPGAFRILGVVKDEPFDPEEEVQEEEEEEEEDEDTFHLNDTKEEEEEELPSFQTWACPVCPLVFRKISLIKQHMFIAHEDQVQPFKGRVHQFWHSLFVFHPPPSGLTSWNCWKLQGSSQEFWFMRIGLIQGHIQKSGGGWGAKPWYFLFLQAGGINFLPQLIFLIFPSFLLFSVIFFLTFSLPLF